MKTPATWSVIAVVFVLGSFGIGYAISKQGWTHWLLEVCALVIAARVGEVVYRRLKRRRQQRALTFLARLKK